MNVIPRFSADWLGDFTVPQPMPNADFKQSFASTCKTALHFGLTDCNEIASALTSPAFSTNMVSLKSNLHSSLVGRFTSAEFPVSSEHHCTEFELITADGIYADSRGTPLIEVRVTGLPYVIEAKDSFDKLADEQRAVVLMALEFISEATSGVVQPDFMRSGGADYAMSYFWDIGGDEIVDSYKELIGSGVAHREAARRVLSGYDEREDELSECFSAYYLFDLFDDLRIESEIDDLMKRYPKIESADELLAKASVLFRSSELIGWFSNLASFVKNHPVHPRLMNELIGPIIEEGECSPEFLINIARSPFAFTQIDEFAEGMMQVGEQSMLRLWAKDESEIDAVLSHVSRIRSGIHLTAWLENCVLAELAYSETSSTETLAQREMAA